MQRSLLAGLCLVYAACATEPRVDDDYFEGTITAVFKVIDTFQNTTDYTLTVDQNPLISDPANPCADRASVHLSDETRIAWTDAPDVRVGPDELAPARRVRVQPAEPTGSGCSRSIEATSILIVRGQ